MADSDQMAHRPPANLKARLKESYDAIAPTYNAWTMTHSSLRHGYLDKLLGHLLPPSPGGSGKTQQPGQLFRVLELGCGAGIPVVQTLMNFDFGQVNRPGSKFHVVANDLSSMQIELGKEKLGGSILVTPEEAEGRVSNSNTTAEHGGNKVEWIQADMTTLSFPDESFDAIIGLYSLIHLPREEQEVMIRRMARWLRRPGIDLVSDTTVLEESMESDGGVMLVNFSSEGMEGVVMERWLGEERGWMYWSGWGGQKTEKIVKGVGLEVLVSELVSEVDDGIDACFLWVIARRGKE